MQTISNEIQKLYFIIITNYENDGQRGLTE